MISARVASAVTAWLGVALLMVAIASPALAQESPVQLEVVDLEADGNQISVTVVAPSELRDGEVTLGSFVVDVGDVSIAPRISRIPGEQLDVVLLVDTSGSMTPEALAAAKASGAAFVAQLPARSRVAVVSFADQVIVEQVFTSNHLLVVSMLDSLETGGETALYAGVVEAARQFDPRRDATRTVVLLSDGGNTVDESSLGAAQTALAASGATLHAISIESNEANPAELEALAESTAGSEGSVVRVDDVNLIAELYGNIAADLRNQYRLEFEAPGVGRTTATVVARQGEATLAEISLFLSLPQLPAPAAAAPTAVAAQPTPAPVAVPDRASASAPNVTRLNAEENPLLKWSSIAAVGIALAIMGMLLMTPGERTHSRAMKPSDRFVRDTQGSKVRSFADRLTRKMDSLLNGRRVGPWLASLLDTAGWKVRNSEFLVLIGLISLVAFFTGAIFSFWMGVTFVVVVLLFVAMLLVLMVSRRRDAFASQLNATLQMLAGALRTGYSLPQAISLVGQESEAPTSEEFSRIAVEMRLGRDLVEATRAVGHRMKNADFLWTTGAIEIAREVGGDLSEVLDNVGATVRTRDRVRRQILALSAEGRVSAWILIALPFPIFFWQLFINRTYTMLLFTTNMGRIIFFSGVSLLIIGFFWLRSQISIEY